MARRQLLERVAALLAGAARGGGGAAGRAAAADAPLARHLHCGAAPLVGPTHGAPRQATSLFGLAAAAAAALAPPPPPARAAAAARQRRGVHASRPAAAKSYYEVLGVPRSAGDAEIKKAFYALAKKHHPDANGGDPAAAAKFQEAQRAYDALRDPQKRAAYDRMGHAAFEAAEAGGGGPPPGGGFPGGGQQVDPEELFREFFGRGGGGGGGFSGGGGGGGFEGTIFEAMFGGGGGGGGFGRPRRGRNLQAALSLTFDEAVRGATKRLDLSALGGASAAKGAIEVAVPAGVDSGFQLRVEGAGAPGPGGAPPGDLLLQMVVAPCPRGLAREGFDVHVEVAVSFADAALGTSVDVPTVDGSAEVRVKPGTQPGERLRMRGYGVRMDAVGGRGRRGDQYVRVRVTVPRSLTPRQRALLEELRGGPAADAGAGGAGGAGGGAKAGAKPTAAGGGDAAGGSGGTAKTAKAEDAGDGGGGAAKRRSFKDWLTGK